MKITLKKIIWIVIIAAILIGAYFMGGNYAENSSNVLEKTAADISNNKIPEEKEPEEIKAVPENTQTATETEKTEPAFENTEAKEEEKEEIVTPEVKENICTLSISCNTILNNMDMLDKNKVDIVPQNGIILDKITVSFNDNESVFNVLRRETKRNKIHLEFSNTPLYNSIYIEGIGNLYEFDCGELSGWTYKVNGISPGYSSSEYTVKNGDVIEWIYTCDLGRDVGATLQINN